MMAQQTDCYIYDCRNSVTDVWLVVRRQVAVHTYRKHRVWLKPASAHFLYEQTPRVQVIRGAINLSSLHLVSCVWPLNVFCLLFFFGTHRRHLVKIEQNTTPHVSLNICDIWYQLTPLPRHFGWNNFPWNKMSDSSEHQFAFTIC